MYGNRKSEMLKYWLVTVSVLIDKSLSSAEEPDARKPCLSDRRGSSNASELALRISLVHHKVFDSETRLIHFLPGIRRLLHSDAEVLTEYQTYMQTTLFSTEDELLADIIADPTVKAVLDSLPFTISPSGILWGHANLEPSSEVKVQRVILAYLKSFTSRCLCKFLPRHLLLNYDFFFEKQTTLKFTEGIPTYFSQAKRHGFDPVGYFSSSSKSFDFIHPKVLRSWSTLVDLDGGCQVLAREQMFLIPERKVAMFRDRGGRFFLMWGREGTLQASEFTSEIWDDGNGGFKLVSDMEVTMKGYRFVSPSVIQPISGGIVDGLVVVNAPERSNIVRELSMFPLVKEVVDLVNGRSLFTYQPRNIRREYIHAVYDVTEARDRLVSIEEAANVVWAVHREAVLAGTHSDIAELNRICWAVHHSAIDSEYKMDALEKLLKFTQSHEDVSYEHLADVVRGIIKP